MMARIEMAAAGWRCRTIDITVAVAIAVAVAVAVGGRQ
jgi:hypothetical protein